MSRIGRKPITVPAGVNVKLDGANVSVKGPKGTLDGEFSPVLTIRQEGNEILVERPDDENETRALHGLTRSLLANMVEGVEKGFSKKLQIVGVGYKASLEGKTLVLNVGFSHSVKLTPPEGIEVTLPETGKILVSGADKQAVGEFAAKVRKVRPPEPYKGKGIRYEGEYVRHKEGKAGKAAK